MFATRTRLAAAWAIDLYLGHALWFCITTQAALPEMQGGVFWLLPVVTARLLLTQIASTPGRHALAIDIHDRLDSRVARGEDVFSRLLGTAFLFFGVQLLIQAATRAPTAVPFGPGDDAALLVLGPYVLAAMFISSAIELLRLGRLGWYGAMAGCIATMFWVLLAQRPTISMIWARGANPSLSATSATSAASAGDVASSTWPQPSQIRKATGSLASWLCPQARKALREASRWTSPCSTRKSRAR